MISKGLGFARSNTIALLALFVALGGTSYAATGGFTSNGTIKACVNAEGGLKLLKAGKHCKRGQKAVAWNQTGPSGAAGAKGTSGTPGAPGAVGTAGAAGPSGSPAVTLWAEIDEAGKLKQAKGVTGISGPVTNPQVTFDRDISKCALTATLNEGLPGDVFAGHGEAPNVAGVATTSKAGFTLVVNC
jgi:hypothetical protein